MTAAQHLAQYNLTVEFARDFVVSNLGNLPFVFDVCKTFGVTNAMLSEIYGGVSAYDVKTFWSANGLDANQLDNSNTITIPTPSVVMKGTEVGYLYSMSSMEIPLSLPLSISQLQDLNSYASTSGAFGSNAMVVSMQQPGDPVGFTSYIHIALGSGSTFTPGVTQLDIQAQDVNGNNHHVIVAMPQIGFTGTIANDTYLSTHNAELMNLSLGGTDTVVLAPLGAQGYDYIYNFLPGELVGSDVLDLRHLSIHQVADSAPSNTGVQAFNASTAYAIDVSNQAVLVIGNEVGTPTVSYVTSLFSTGGAFTLAANSNTMLILFNDNSDQHAIYVIANDANASVVSTEVYDYGIINVVGVNAFTPYVDGSFSTSNFTF